MAAPSRKYILADGIGSLIYAKLCTYAHAPTRMCTTCARTHVRNGMHTYIVHTHAPVHARTCARTHVQYGTVHTYARTYSCTHTHIRTHTHAHTHTHTHTLTLTHALARTRTNTHEHTQAPL
jgi:hypothetical protein